MSFSKIHSRLLPKMGEFAGLSLPLRFGKFNSKDVILNTRKPGFTTVFDVSHMGVYESKNLDNLIGKKLEKLLYIDIDKLTNNNIDAFSVFKTKVKWSKTKNTWDNPATDTYPNSSQLDERTYPEQFIEGYVQDMIFNAIDANGNLLKPPPSPTNSNKKKLYDIKTVDIALAVRSKNPFYNENKKKSIFALTDSSRDLTRFNDRFLRETLTVTAYARNVGLE